MTKINQDSVFQQTWYKFTDSISQSTPNLASRLDVYKENIEDYIISKRVFAYRERERQVRERLISIERSRIEQQEERLRRLTKLYEREQIKSEQSDQREAEIQRLQQFENRRIMLRQLEDEERHTYHRSEIQRIKIFDLIVKKDIELFGDSFDEYLSASQFDEVIIWCVVDKCLLIESISHNQFVWPVILVVRHWIILTLQCNPKLHGNSIKNTSFAWQDY